MTKLTKFTSPVIIRYMTLLEEADNPDQEGLAVEYPVTGKREIALRRGASMEEKTAILPHELGHHKYPTAVGIDRIGGSIYNELDYIFGELGASYYALKLNPKDKESRINLRNWKNHLIRKTGLSRRQVARLDRIARKRVGYEGKSIG